jgi:poly(3-hydroxybutyrate) depolymerase
MRRSARMAKFAKRALAAGIAIWSDWWKWGPGHAWSGGDATVPYHSNIGPDASWLIWQFLRQHKRAA